MDKEELEQLVDELQTDDGGVKPIPTQEGMIAYRKYLWALWFIEQRVDRLKTYRSQVVGDIDHKIEREQENIARIRQQIEMALELDPIAEKTKAGGRKLSLPDIATVSISKVSDKVVIDDPNEVLNQLGQDFAKVVTSLDVPSAKEALKKMVEKNQSLPSGVHTEKSRTLSIRFTK